MDKMNPVVHFDIPGEDTARMSKFYEKAFGWKTLQLGEEMGFYTLVTTTESEGQPGMPKEPGRINGGFYPKSPDPLSNFPSVVIAVDNIEESIKKVEDAGGKPYGKVQEIPGIGYSLAFVDTEGNRLSMIQYTMK